MKYWDEYIGHLPKIAGKRNRYDTNIYTFDIETTSYIKLNDKILEAKEYLNLTDDEKNIAEYNTTMYIWMFGINNNIYYGRTYKELKMFLLRLETWGTNYKKFVFVHNLSWEFEFLRNIFKFKKVKSRKNHKVMSCEIEEFNIEFRCSYYMTNAPLRKLPQVYGLNAQKLVGELDYNKIRHSRTKLTEKELKYCENDCLVVYEYIKRELETYKSVKQTPLTSTGHVRRELKEKIDKDYSYKNKVRRAINTDGHIYNLLLERICRRIYTFKLDLYR